MAIDNNLCKALFERIFAKLRKTTQATATILFNVTILTFYNLQTTKRGSTLQGVKSNSRRTARCVLRIVVQKCLHTTNYFQWPIMLLFSLLHEILTISCCCNGAR